MNVPPEERVCGVVAGDYEIGDGGDFETQEEFQEFASQKISAAAHAYGQGSIGYFGDTNCSRHNPCVVAAYCRSGWEAKRRELHTQEVAIGLARKVSEQKMAESTEP